MERETRKQLVREEEENTRRNHSAGANHRHQKKVIMDNNSSEVVIQWNVQGSSTFKQYLIKLIELYSPIVIATQETYLAIDDYQIKLNGYHAVSKQGTYNQRWYEGVALYIYSTCPFQDIGIQSKYQVVAASVQVGQGKRIAVASIYIPGSISVEEQDMWHILNQLLRLYLLVGYLNADNPLWRGTVYFTRGRMVEDIIHNDSINILSTGSLAHCSGTAIDLSFASPTIAADYMRSISNNTQ